MAQLHGRRLLPTTIDELAREDPDRAWGSMQPKGSSKFQDISISVFANAINRVAHWIVTQVEAPSTSSDGKKIPLAYIGPSDLRYYVMFMAIVKAGYVPLFISHLNSRAANVSLFASTGCKTLLCGFGGLDNVALASEDAEVNFVPSVDKVWDATPVPHFPFDLEFEEAFHDPLVIMHTSGSTGMPKPITYTHGSYATWDSRQDITGFEGLETDVHLRARSLRHFIGLPPFHAAGLASGLQDSVFFGTTIVFPPADRPLNAQTVAEVIDNGRFEGAALLPHTLEDLARNPRALQRLRELRYVFWVGGPISQRTGDLISAQTPLINAYASTEMGSAVTLVKSDRSLWNYYFFHPEANGFDFRPVAGQPNVYELFVLKNLALQQPVFCLFPHLDEWPTKDLFIPHPILKHHWRLEGRSDNLIVLQNGSKVNPHPIEAIVRNAPGVNEVLMFGAHQARPGMLIEPVSNKSLGESNTAAKSEFLDSVFSFVETSNQTAPTNGVIIRELLALTKMEKPLPRTGKRTVQRPMALALYKDDIDTMYKALPSHLQRVKDFRIGSE